MQSILDRVVRFVDNDILRSTRSGGGNLALDGGSGERPGRETVRKC